MAYVQPGGTCTLVLSLTTLKKESNSLKLGDIVT